MAVCADKLEDMNSLKPEKMSDSEDEEVTDSMVKDTPVKTRGTVKKVIVYTFIYVVGLAVIVWFSGITVVDYLRLILGFTVWQILSLAGGMTSASISNDFGVPAVSVQALEQFTRRTNTHILMPNFVLLCSSVSAVIVTLLYIFILRATFRQTGQGYEDTTQVNSLLSTMTSFSEKEQDLSTSNDEKSSRPHESFQVVSEEERESDVILSRYLSLQVPPSEKKREFSTSKDDKLSRHASIQVPPSEKEWGLSTSKDVKSSWHSSMQAPPSEKELAFAMLSRHLSEEKRAFAVLSKYLSEEKRASPDLYEKKDVFAILSRHLSEENQVFALLSEKDGVSASHERVMKSMEERLFDMLLSDLPKEKWIHVFPVHEFVVLSLHLSEEVGVFTMLFRHLSKEERVFASHELAMLSSDLSFLPSFAMSSRHASTQVPRPRPKMTSFSEKEREFLGNKQFLLRHVPQSGKLEIDQNETEHEKKEQACPSPVVRDPSFPKEPQEFVRKPCNAPRGDVDEQADADITDSVLATHSDCSTSSSSSESSSTESEKEHDQDEQTYPLPVFSETWQHSATFSSKGGYLHKPGSESNLHVQKGAISSSEDVNISTAVCADLDKMLKLLEIRDDVNLAYPLVEYWAGRDFSFVKDVTISLPHFIPPGIDAADVHVFCITSSSDGLKHESPDAEDGDTESLDTAKPLVASKQLYLHVQEIHHFHVFGDIVEIFTKHFCGFLCVYCDKETDKKPPRPKLYAMGGGQISTVNGQQHVDLALHIWDERIKNADFRQNDCIRSLPTHTIERIELLEDFQDTQICVNLKLNDEEQNALVHRMVHEGQPSLPCQEIFDFPRFLACKKCVKKGKLEPKTFKWAFKSRPGVPRLQSLEIVVEIVHSKNQPDKHIMTPLLLRVQYQQQSSQYEMRGKKTGFFARLLHPTSRNTPDSGASHSIPASPCQQGNETTSQADHALALPPPLQSLRRSDALAQRLAPRISAPQARRKKAGTKRRTQRPHSQDLPQDASSASSSLEGAVGGCDVMNREMTESTEQIILTPGELQQIVDQHVAQRLQCEKRAWENKIKNLERQFRSLSLNTQMRPPGSNALQLHRPAEPLEDTSHSDNVELCNPSVTSSDADVSESDSFQSCDDEQLVPPECVLDNLK